ncbi:MAG: hypothetical protein IKL36_04175 [Clostridia bacterium]|nr:hypothetical protein [Clostridia bacterium]
MRIPYQKRILQNKKSIAGFRGLDRRVGMGANSFYNMTNMSGKEPNCISTRNKRGKLDLNATKINSFISTDVKIDGVIRENVFITLGGDRLKAYYYENNILKTKILMSTADFTSNENCMIASGGYLYFFPDNKYVNLMNLGDKGNLGAKVDLPYGANDEFFFETEFISTDEKGIDQVNDSGYVKIVCKKYKNDTSQKGEYVSNFNYTYEFNEDDFIEIHGTVFDGLYKIAYIPETDDYLVVKGYLDSDFSQNDSLVTISRNIPEMDYVTAAGNRLWGCRYGINEKGQPVNEIYACRLGDAKNWYSFEGISTDSYSVSVGVDGVFTGAITYEGDPFFFKEDSVLRIYGSRPSDFKVITNNIRGIENGSSKSLVIVDDTLYYKTYNGIVAYNGGMPYNIDEALGSEIYRNAAAGCRCGNYYVSMENECGEYELFVYDTSEKEWYREDNMKVTEFCRSGNELYMLVDSDDGSKIYSVGGEGEVDNEKTIFWSLESPDIDYYLAGKKATTKLEIKLKLSEGSYFNAEISYDGDRNWHKIAAENGPLRCISVVLRPRRCDSFRLRFSGHGEVSFVSMTRYTTESGDKPGGR